MGDIYTIPMIISIITFILSTHITPGPTNVILLSSVITFGYKKTLPFMIANIISYLIMVVFVGLGMEMFLSTHPDIMSIFKIVGITYLCWMAWKIANSSANIDDENSTKTKPFTFTQSLIYPWLNPKAWIVYSSMLSIFITSPEESLSQMLIILILIFITLVLNSYLWTFGAIVLKHFLKNEKIIKRVNQSMAILLVLSIVPILI